MTTSTDAPLTTADKLRDPRFYNHHLVMQTRLCFEMERYALHKVIALLRAMPPKACDAVETLDDAVADLRSQCAEGLSTLCASMEVHVLLSQSDQGRVHTKEVDLSSGDESVVAVRAETSSTQQVHVQTSCGRNVWVLLYPKYAFDGDIKIHFVSCGTTVMDAPLLDRHIVLNASPFSPDGRRATVGSFCMWVDVLEDELPKHRSMFASPVFPCLRPETLASAAARKDMELRVLRDWSETAKSAGLVSLSDCSNTRRFERNAEAVVRYLKKSYLYSEFEWWRRADVGILHNMWKACGAIQAWRASGAALPPDVLEFLDPLGTDVHVGVSKK